MKNTFYSQCKNYSIFLKTYQASCSSSHLAEGNIVELYISLCYILCSFTLHASFILLIYVIRTHYCFHLIVFVSNHIISKINVNKPIVIQF